MFKIKLLILLLSSILVNCATSPKVNNPKLDLNYISGGVDGVIMDNMLTNLLQNYGLYDGNSKFKLDASISHKNDFFITNIDNTSERNLVSSSLRINIIDQVDNCEIYQSNNEISQFYIVVSTKQFTSNDAAQEKIKKENTENLIKLFLEDYLFNTYDCD
tara:strand:- start:423 stop:902 length:480 start_codon:yes stop_codon:yes gene_type:complete